jgi:hypothetical protein
LLLAALVENALVFESFLAISYPFCQKVAKIFFPWDFSQGKRIKYLTEEMTLISENKRIKEKGSEEKE